MFDLVVLVRMFVCFVARVFIFFADDDQEHKQQRDPGDPQVHDPGCHHGVPHVALGSRKSRPLVPYSAVIVNSVIVDSDAIG